jgi:hypothetical protein
VALALERSYRKTNFRKHGVLLSLAEKQKRYQTQHLENIDAKGTIKVLYSFTGSPDGNDAASPLKPGGVAAMSRRNSSARRSRVEIRTVTARCTP